MRILFLLLCLSCSGCSLLYENHYEGLGFKIYSNQSEDLVKEVGSKTARIRHAYQSLFNLSNEELGTMHTVSYTHLTLPTMYTV